MQVERHWPQIRDVFKASPYAVFGTVNADGSPQVTPIGSVFLSPDEPRGYFLERFVRRLSENLDTRPDFMLLAVNSKLTFWLGSLIRGQFVGPPAVRLVGRAAPRRPVTGEEQARFARRVRPVAWTRGYGRLWANFETARDLEFTAFTTVHLGPMAKGVWAPVRGAGRFPGSRTIAG